MTTDRTWKNQSLPRGTSFDGVGRWELELSLQFRNLTSNLFLDRRERIRFPEVSAPPCHGLGRCVGCRPFPELSSNISARSPSRVWGCRLTAVTGRLECVRPETHSSRHCQRHCAIRRAETGECPRGHSRRGATLGTARTAPLELLRRTVLKFNCVGGSTLPFPPMREVQGSPGFRPDP